MILSCAKTQEEKAAELAKKAVKEVAYYPDTYEAGAVKVDSVFHTVFLDDVAMQATKKICDAEEEIKRVEYTIDNAKSNIALWSGPYLTAYDREQRSQAHKELSTATEKLEKLQHKVEKNTDIVLKRAEDLAKPEFAGWAITHKYSLKNASGQRRTSEIVVITDVEMKDIIFSIYPDNKEFTQIINKMKEILGVED